MPEQNIIKTGPVSNKDLEKMNSTDNANWMVPFEGGIARGLDTLDRAYNSRQRVVYDTSDEKAMKEWSKYKGANVASLSLYNDTMAGNQSTFEHLLYGLGQNIVTMGTSAATLMASPFLIGYGLLSNKPGLSGAWNNKFMNIISSVQDWSNEVMPNYKSEDGSFFENFGSNLQSFLQTLGYVEGFIGGQAVASSIGRGVLNAMNMTKKVGKSASGLVQMISGQGPVASAVGNVLSSFAEADDQTHNDVRQWKEEKRNELQSEIESLRQEYYNNFHKNKGKETVDINGTLYDKAYLDYMANMEDLDNMAKQQLSLVDNMSNSMGDNIMLSNMALLIPTNYISWDKMFGGGYRKTKRAFKLLGKSGEFAVPTKRIMARAVAKGLGEAVSEGFQEKAQSAFTNVATDYYDDVIKRWKEGKGEVALDDTLSFLENFAQGMKRSVTTAENMDEAVMGFLTSIVGVPMIGRGANSGSYIGRNKILGMSGGMFSEIREGREEINAAKEGMKALNAYYENQEKNANMVRSIAMMNKYAKDQTDAAILGDKFGYENAKAMEVMTMIDAFDNSGRMQELKDSIASLENISDEDAEAIIDLTTKKLKDANNKEFEAGPYINEDGTRMSTEEVKKQLNDNKNYLSEFLDYYSKQKESLDNMSFSQLSNEQLSEITWMYGMLKNFDKRAEEIQKKLSTYINDAADFYSTLQKPELAAQIRGLQDKNLQGKDRTIALEALKVYVNSTSSEADVSKDLTDLGRIINAHKELQKKYTEYLTKPPKPGKKSVAEQVREQVQNKVKNKKFKTLNDAKTFSEFRDAKSKFSAEDYESFKKDNSNNPFVSQIDEFEDLSSAIKIQLHSTNIDDATQEDKDIAQSLINEHIKNAESIDDLKNTNNEFFAEQSVTNPKAVDIARIAIQKAINPKRTTQQTNTNQQNNQQQNKENSKENNKENDKENNNKDDNDKSSTEKTEESNDENVEDDNKNDENENNEDESVNENESESVDNKVIEDDNENESSIENAISELSPEQIDELNNDEIEDNNDIDIDAVQNSFEPRFHKAPKKSIDKKETLLKEMEYLVLGTNTKEIKSFSTLKLRILQKIAILQNEASNESEKQFLSNMSNAFNRMTDVEFSEFVKNAYSKNLEIIKLVTYAEFTREYYEPMLNEFSQDLEFSFDKNTTDEQINESYRKWLDQIRTVFPDYKPKQEFVSHEECDRYRRIGQFLKDHNAFENAKDLQIDDKIRLGIDTRFKVNLEDENSSVDTGTVFMYAQDEKGQYTKIVGVLRHGNVWNERSEELQNIRGVEGYESHYNGESIEQLIRKQYNEHSGKIKNNIFYLKTGAKRKPAAPIKVKSLKRGIFKVNKDANGNKIFTKLSATETLKNPEKIYIVKIIDNKIEFYHKKNGEIIPDNDIYNKLEQQYGKDFVDTKFKNEKGVVFYARTSCYGDLVLDYLTPTKITKDSIAYENVKQNVVTLIDEITKLHKENIKDKETRQKRKFNTLKDFRKNINKFAHIPKEIKVNIGYNPNIGEWYINAYGQSVSLLKDDDNINKICDLFTNNKNVNVTDNLLLNSQLALDSLQTCLSEKEFNPTFHIGTYKISSTMRNGQRDISVVPTTKDLVKEQKALQQSLFNDEEDVKIDNRTENKTKRTNESKKQEKQENEKTLFTDTENEVKIQEAFNKKPSYSDLTIEQKDILTNNGINNIGYRNISLEELNEILKCH